MRRPDETPLDPEIKATLEAIDATLAGEPVDPRFAEMAEIALLVADERPRPRAVFTDALDARVARRFAPAAAPAPPPGWLRTWGWASAATVAVVIALAVVVLQSGPHFGGSSMSSSSSSSAGIPSLTTPSSRGTSSSSAGAGATAAAGTFGLNPGTGKSLSSTASSAGNASASLHAKTPPSVGSPAYAPSPEGLSLPPNGRKTIQSAEIDLAAAPNAIDRVGQEVLNVVGAENGIVDRSNVTQTGGLDGSASFALRIPSQNLPQALDRLSQLSGASVLSRTDNSQDVNSQYVSSTRALADAQALRAALVRQLAAATTTAEIDSLQARLNEVEGTITADTASLRGLTAQIDYAGVTVTISARSGLVAPTHTSHGFTLGHAVHVAGRVLVVVAGVGLIALAAMVPVALVVVLLAWLAGALRRRRREQALDFA